MTALTDTDRRIIAMLGVDQDACLRAKAKALARLEQPPKTPVPEDRLEAYLRRRPPKYVDWPVERGTEVAIDPIGLKPLWWRTQQSREIPVNTACHRQISPHSDRYQFTIHCNQVRKSVPQE